jgi:hypothetical protein
LDAEDLSRLHLSEATLFDEPIYLKCEAGFQQFLFGMRKPEIRKNIAAALFEFPASSRNHVYLMIYLVNSAIRFRRHKP